MNAMLSLTAGASFFGEEDLAHSYYQDELHPNDAHIQKFRDLDAHSLCELQRDLQGFKTSEIPLQVHDTELLAQIKKSFFIWLDISYAQQKPAPNTSLPLRRS